MLPDLTEVKGLHDEIYLVGFSDEKNITLGLGFVSKTLH